MSKREEKLFRVFLVIGVLLIGAGMAAGVYLAGWWELLLMAVPCGGCFVVCMSLDAMKEGKALNDIMEENDGETV